MTSTSLVSSAFSFASMTISSLGGMNFSTLKFTGILKRKTISSVQFLKLLFYDFLSTNRFIFLN